MLCVTQVFAQNRTITGTVKAKDDGQPIPGATVKIKGSNTGTQTDASGKFSISAGNGTVLVFSFVGYAPLEVTVGSGSIVNATLTPASKQLTEVVVTSFGIQRQAASLGYSTTKVSGSDANNAKPVSVANGLTGKVSGLQVNTINAGLFAPTRITLRGNRSLIGNNQPLIVVDGSVYYSDISTLNPEDIQSYDVLKGSSSSAVYGSDASNGVIVITTKHGARKPSVTVSTTVDVENVSYMPKQQNQFGSNGGENFVNDFNKFGDFDASGNYIPYYLPYENQSYGPLFNGKMVPVGRPDANGNVEMVPYAPIKNQKKDFLNTGFTTHYNFSYDAGDETGSVHMSAQDINSKSVMPGDVGRRDIFRVGGDKNYGIFSATYGATYTHFSTNKTATNAVYDDLLESPLFIPVADLKDPDSKYGNPDNYYNDYYFSPGQIIKSTRFLDDENHINANLALKLKPWKWLNFTYRASFENIQTRNQQEFSGITYSPYRTDTSLPISTTIYYPSPDGTGAIIKNPGDGAGTKYSATNALPSYGVQNFNNMLLTSDFLANYNNKFFKDFSLDATAGVSYMDNKISADGINQTALNFLPYNVQNFASTPGLGNGSVEARKLGYLGEATVGYKNFAFVHGSFRTDLDTRLSKANRYIPYYDIDGSLVLSEMFKSITENGVLDFAKVRYAHSLTGNVSALSGGSQYIAYGAYQTMATYGLAGGFPYSSSGLGGYSLNTTIANPDIKPEKVTEDEVGLDLGFLSDRITLGASYYQSTTKDGIVYASVSSASGFTKALVNAANTANKGLELDLGGTIIKHGGLEWSMKVNWTHQTSKVNSIVSGVTALNVGNAAYAVVGYAYPQIETYDWNRDPSNGKVIVDANTGLPTRASKLSILGQTNPKDIIGITSNLKYKSFTFTMTWDYRAGHKVYVSDLGTTLDHSGTSITSVVAGRQRFVFPNSEYLNSAGQYVPNTNVEVQDGNFNFWPTLYQSVRANYVISAAAWKLREASVSYSLPKKWLNEVRFIKGASIGVSGRNLLMFVPGTNKFTDPEFANDTGNGVGTSGLGQLPPTRIISGTLSVTL